MDSKPDPETGVNECDHWIAIAYDGWGGDVVYQSQPKPSLKEDDRILFKFCPLCGVKLTQEPTVHTVDASE